MPGDGGVKFSSDQQKRSMVVQCNSKQRDRNAGGSDGEALNGLVKLGLGSAGNCFAAAVKSNDMFGKGLATISVEMLWLGSEWPRSATARRRSEGLGIEALRQCSARPCTAIARKSEARAKQ